MGWGDAAVCEDGARLAGGCGVLCEVCWHLVVFAHVDEGKLPERRHVERLEELALRGRTPEGGVWG
jgi:hypothetical protein